MQSQIQTGMIDGSKINNNDLGEISPGVYYFFIDVKELK